ncbi:MAG: PAS domain S-box protein [Candidatus Odinarchaeota archaeon]
MKSLDNNLDRETLAAYFEHTGTATCIVESDMTITKCNRQFEVLSGYTKKEIEGKIKAIVFSHPDDRTQHERNHLERRTNSKSVPHSYETRFIDRDGNLKNVAVTVGLIPGTKKSIVSMLDVTESKRAEKALRKSEERYRVLFEDSPISLWEIDTTSVRKYIESLTTSGVEDFSSYFKDHPEAAAKCVNMIKIIDVNKTTVDMYEARSKEELINRKMNIFFSGESYDIFRDIIVAFSEGKIRFESEAINWTLSGVKKHITIRCSVIPEQEKTTPDKVLVSITDITKHKESDEARLESENRYRMLFESSPDGILIFDVQTREFKYANPAICRMLGYREDELGRMGVKDIYPEDVLPFLLSEFEEQARGEKTLTRNVPCLRKDGTMFYADINTVSTVDAEGRVYNIGFLRDMTKYEEAEKALRESEGRYRKLVELSPDAITLTDLDTNIIMVNKQNVEILGYNSAEELIGRNALDLFIPEDRERAVAFARKTIEQESQKNLEYTLYRKDGSTIQVEINTALIRDDDGNPKAFMSVGRDVTARNKLDAELKHRLAMEKLVTSISTRFINLAPDNVDEGIGETLERIGKFAGVDRSYVFLLDEEGVLATNTHEWCADGIVSRLESFKSLFLEHFPWAMEMLYRGENIHVPRFDDLPPEADSIRKELLETGGSMSFIVVPMKSGQSLIGALGFDSVRSEKTWSEEDIALLKMVGDIFVNALERKKAVEKLRKQKEETSLYLDIIAHDLGNYLGAVKGYIDLSLQKPPREVTEKYLQKSRASVERASALLRNISILMKQVVSTRYDLQPVSVAAAINNVNRTLQALYPYRNIIVTKNEEITDCSILADSLFDQLILNLLTNAVKNDENDPVMVDIGIKSGTRDGTCLLTVTDHGKGIPEEEREGIFERFNDFGKNGKGSGLGLFIVKTLVNRYKGKVWIESRNDQDYTKGTRFCVELQLV